MHCLQLAHRVCRGRRAVCLLVLCYSLICVAGGVQIRAVESSAATASCAEHADRRHLAVYRVPRPLVSRQEVGTPRAGVGTATDSASRSLATEAVARNCRAERVAERLPTLLEEAVARPDSQAFFLASTLIETLLEHFHPVAEGLEDGASNGVGGVSSEGMPTRALCLDVLIPTADQLAIAHTGCVSSVEHFDLTDGQCIMPCTDSLFDDLCRWADVRMLRGPLHPVDKAWRFQHWVRDGMPGRLLAPGERLVLTADGSFCPSTLRAGWAVAVALARPPDVVGQFVGCIYGPVPALAKSQAVNAYVAEIWGLVWAGVVALQFPACREVLIRADNLSALHGAAGEESMAPLVISDVLRGIHIGLRTILCGQVQYSHVAGHSGDCPNELADGLANVGSHGESSLGPFRFAVDDWMQQDALAARWFPHACLSRSRPSLLPSTRNDLIVWPETQLPPAMPADKLMKPFLRAVQGPTSSAKKKSQHFSCRCVSYNALSLLQADDTAAGRAAGLHGAVGRVALLRKALLEHRVFLAGIQEARTDQGCCHNEDYARYCSGGTDRRCLGVELWVAQGQAWPAHKFVVGHVDPRRLLGRLNFLGMTFNVLVAHGLHRGHSVKEREDWWRHTARLCMAVHDNLDWIVMLDGNCRVGSVVSERIGAHQADIQDEGGACLHDLVACIGVWLPATFSHCMEGAGGTFVQKQTQELQRCDFVGLPDRWKQWKVSAIWLPSLRVTLSLPLPAVAKAQRASTRLPFRRRRTLSAYKRFWLPHLRWLGARM